jgi:membrane protease YdiL (CAAX protease family)
VTLLSDLEPSFAQSDSSPAVSIPAAPPPPTLRRLFFGDDGLRAGWSVLLYLILLALTGTVVTLVVKHLHAIPKTMPKELTPRFSAIDKLVEFSLFAIPALLMSLIERRSFARYGLSTRRLLPDFFTGLFWGFASLSLLVGLLLLTHGIVFQGVLLHGATVITFALKWLLVFFLVGLGEEFLFRGYLQYTVARGVAGITRTMDPHNRYSHTISFWVSAFLFSFCFFILAHTGNGGENAIGLFQVGLAGTVFAFSLYRTGTLWWAIGMHTSWDWAQSYFYGTADSGTVSVGRLLNSHPIGSRLLSGGPDGPEGSVLCIPILLAIAIVIHFTLPKRDYPLTPDQSPLPPDHDTLVTTI